MHRHYFKDVLEAMAYLNSSSESSSDENDLDLLLVDLSFAPKRVVVPRLNIVDLSNLQCGQLFR